MLCFFGWLVDFLFIQSVCWLVGCLDGLIGKLIVLSFGWLVGWLVGFFNIVKQGDFLQFLLISQ